MNKVIPAVGQVWTDSNGNEYNWKDVKSSFSGDYFSCQDGGSYAASHINDLFTFKPANDLEWLAVNEPVWNSSRPDFNIAKRGEKVVYGDERYISDAYTKQQHQDKRNELFGEKVVKTKDQLLNEVNISIQDNTSDGIEVNLQESRAKGGPIKATVSNPMHEYSNVTIKPAKKMKVEYVEAKFNHAWEAVKEYQEEGDLFCDICGKYEVIPNAMSAHRAFNGDNIYRRVETEVTWQERVAYLVESKFGALGFDHDLDDMLKNSVNDDDWSVKFNQEIIEVCREVVSHVGMTDKPE